MIMGLPVQQTTAMREEQELVAHKDSTLIAELKAPIKVS
jgi:hypothetical protein